MAGVMTEGMVKTMRDRWAIRSQAVTPEKVMGAVHRLNGDGAFLEKEKVLRYSRSTSERKYLSVMS